MQGSKGFKGILGSIFNNSDEYWDDEEYEDELEEDENDSGNIIELASSKKRRQKGTNIVDFEANREVQEITTVRLCRPKEILDATLICEYLQDKIVCIVDIQSVDREIGQRIADYLGGVSYALKGQIERVDDRIFIIVPNGVKIDSDLKEEIRGNKLHRSFR
ncbi:MAG: cell division protein SepF [Turicibacter sp.]|nr:cell division protein SepF [Turicibacter sp.]